MRLSSSAPELIARRALRGHRPATAPSSSPSGGLYAASGSRRRHEGVEGCGDGGDPLPSAWRWRRRRPGCRSGRAAPGDRLCAAWSAVPWRARAPSQAVRGALHHARRTASPDPRGWRRGRGVGDEDVHLVASESPVPRRPAFEQCLLIDEPGHTRRISVECRRDLSETCTGCRLPEDPSASKVIEVTLMLQRPCRVLSDDEPPPRHQRHSRSRGQSIGLSAPQREVTSHAIARETGVSSIGYWSSWLAGWSTRLEAQFVELSPIGTTRTSRHHAEGGLAPGQIELPVAMLMDAYHLAAGAIANLSEGPTGSHDVQDPAAPSRQRNGGHPLPSRPASAWRRLRGVADDLGRPPRSA
mgnify:CR=1 FL=1